MPHTDKHLTERIHTMGKGQFAAWTLLSLYGIYAFLFFFFGVWYATGWDLGLFQTFAISIAVTILVTFALRYLIRRPRPTFFETPYVPWLKQYSFPSAHASVSFSLATALALMQLDGGSSTISLVVIVALFALAVFVSVSRIMIGVHYLSDVLAGAVLGTAISFIVTMI